MAHPPPPLLSDAAAMAPANHPPEAGMDLSLIISEPVKASSSYLPRESLLSGRRQESVKPSIVGATRRHDLGSLPIRGPSTTPKAMEQRLISPPNYFANLSADSYLILKTSGSNGFVKLDTGLGTFVPNPRSEPSFYGMSRKTSR
ncbi:hypothetical protein DL770_006250 [Monosporascus sp. CRB-9-2]|nr:hypothetical protein DL770_006250 [Monosporascus sp. CRB-9-2]